MKVLVVDLNYMGDVLMGTPVYKAIKWHTDADIHVLTWPTSAEVLRRNTFLHTIHIVPPGLMNLYRAGAFLRGEDYDIVMQFNTSL